MIIIKGKTGPRHHILWRIFLIPFSLTCVSVVSILYISCNGWCKTPLKASSHNEANNGILEPAPEH
jgi:hypothetical protein